MPKTPIDFSKTNIYKICCNDANITDIYIGHTTDLRRRRYEHKSKCHNENNKEYNLKIYQIIRKNGGWINWTLIQIECFVCENVNEARARERYWIEELKPSLNCDIPNRSKKEYQEDNKEVLAEKNKEYREQNKEVIAKKKKEYCENNKEKIVEKSKKYYEENKDKILERVKNYTEINKEIIAERSKQYRDNNKEELAKKKKEYREQNKEIISKKATERIRCEICNCDVPRRHISTHNKTLKHLSLL
jgi:hypothetical protein